MKKIVKNQRGAFLLMLAILIPLLLAISGLVVDVGYAYIQRSRMQNVADAAALAGAAKIKNESAAKQLAEHYIEKNSEDISTSTIEIIQKNKTKQVNVDLTKTSPTLFLKILNINTMDLSVHAAATGQTQPNILDYALVSAGPQEFYLFDKGAPAESTYEGDIYINGHPVRVDQGTNATHEKNKINGNIYTTSPDLPIDIDKPGNVQYKDLFQTSADPLNLSTDPDIKKFIDDNTNTANTYGPNHPCNGEGGVDFTKFGGNLYVNGNFNVTPSNQGGSSLTKASEVIIVATGDINITGGAAISKNSNVILCSLNGNITFDGSVEDGAKFKCLARKGKINLNGGSINMNGFLIAQQVILGNSGALKIKNPNSAGGSAVSKLRLIE